MAAAVPIRSEPAAVTNDPLQRLAREFVGMQGHLPGLTVGEMGSVTGDGDIIEPEKGLVLCYRPEGAGVEARLWISDRRAKLVTRTMYQTGIWTAMEDRLVLSLDGSPRVAERHCSSMGELAAVLISLMRRRVTDAALTGQDLNLTARDLRLRRPTAAQVRSPRPRSAAGAGARRAVAPG